MCLRARAIKPGWRSGKIATQTYIFLNQVVGQSIAPAGFPTAWGGTSADYAMNPSIVTPQVQAHQGRPQVAPDDVLSS